MSYSKKTLLQAERLLREAIPAESYLELCANDSFVMTGKSKDVYRLAKKSKTRICRGSEIFEACIQLPNECPPADRVVAEYLLIKNNEEEYLKTANLTQIRSYEWSYDEAARFRQQRTLVQAALQDQTMRDYANVYGAHWPQYYTSPDGWEQDNIRRLDALHQAIAERASGMFREYVRRHTGAHEILMAEYGISRLIHVTCEDMPSFDDLMRISFDEVTVRYLRPIVNTLAEGYIRAAQPALLPMSAGRFRPTLDRVSLSTDRLIGFIGQYDIVLHRYSHVLAIDAVVG